MTNRRKCDIILENKDRLKLCNNEGFSERSDTMATFSFDRPLVLDQEGAERLAEILSEPAKPDNIKPYSDSDRKESEELIKKWFESQRNKK